MGVFQLGSHWSGLLALLLFSFGAGVFTLCHCILEYMSVAYFYKGSQLNFLHLRRDFELFSSAGLFRVIRTFEVVLSAFV